MLPAHDGRRRRGFLCQPHHQAVPAVQAYHHSQPCFHVLHRSAVLAGDKDALQICLQIRQPEHRAGQVLKRPAAGLFRQPHEVRHDRGHQQDQDSHSRRGPHRCKSCDRPHRKHQRRLRSQAFHRQERRQDRQGDLRDPGLFRGAGDCGSAVAPRDPGGSHSHLRGQL